MTFPTEAAKNKHEFFIPGDLESCKVESSSALFQTLAKPIPSDLKKLGDVYSYSDAPSPPLSRSLMIVAVADSSISIFRKLGILEEDDESLPDCLQRRSTISTKRADGAHANSLTPAHRKNSTAFAKFMKQLQRENLVAIGSTDKYGRFLLLRPPSDVSPDDQAEYTQSDFVGFCYVGEAKGVKQFLTQGLRQTEAPAPAVDVWQPPSGNDLWEPPGSDAGASNNDTGFSWEPPTTDVNDFSQVQEWAPGESGDGTKRPLDTESSSNGNKRQRTNDGFHTNAGAAAADTFYSNLTRTLTSRGDSRILHMRNYNGWVKATQISELDPKTSKKASPLRVLDLACGKGGDLGKWILHRRGIGNYVGSDVARGSLRDAALRVRKIAKQKLKRCTFTCADLGSDVPGRLKHPSHPLMQKLLTWNRDEEPDGSSGDPQFKLLRGGGISQDDKFDVISIQFAIHYMMQTRKRARRFFQTVSELLEVGGNLIATTIDARVVIDHLLSLGLDYHFDSDEPPSPAVVRVGGACSLKFEPEIVQKIMKSQAAGESSSETEKLFGLEYYFTLVEGSDHAAGVGDAVSLPEWLAPLPSLAKLATDAGLELEYAENFHEFYRNRMDKSAHPDAHSALYNMKVLNRSGSISKDEWEISRLYCAIKFRKVRESSIELDEEPADEEEEEQDKEEPPEIKIDPMQKARLMPKAMKAAKEKVGTDTWQSLSGADKQDLINREIQILATAT